MRNVSRSGNNGVPLSHTDTVDRTWLPTTWSFHTPLISPVVRLIANWQGAVSR